MGNAVELLPASAMAFFIGYSVAKKFWVNRLSPLPYFAVALGFISSWLVSCAIMLAFAMKPSAESSWVLGAAGALITLIAFMKSYQEINFVRTESKERVASDLVRLVLLIVIVIALGFLQYLCTIYDAAGVLAVFGPIDRSRSSEHPAFYLTILNMSLTVGLLICASLLWSGKKDALLTAVMLQVGTIVVPLLAWFSYWILLLIGNPTEVGREMYPIFAEYFSQRAVGAFWLSVVAVAVIVLLSKIRISWETG